MYGQLVMNVTSALAPLISTKDVKSAKTRCLYIAQPFSLEIRHSAVVANLVMDFIGIILPLCVSSK
jgi:hypothetical protein